MSSRSPYPRQEVVHPFPPVYNHHSKILILGAIPSPGSRENGFYYGHPQNRMWRILSALLQEEAPARPDAKRDYLLRHHIAMWDVLRACEIDRAADASIRTPQANDLSPLFQAASFRAVFTTGRKATQMYERYCMNDVVRLPPTYLPSTSPANCRFSLAELIDRYAVILPSLAP